MDAKFYDGWRELVRFSDKNPQPQVLVETEHFKVVVVGLQPSQTIPPHPATMGMYHILEGEGWVTVGKDRVAVEAGATVIVPDGEARGLEAETQMTFLATRVTS